jgi:hypothetical protein
MLFSRIYSSIGIAKSYRLNDRGSIPGRVIDLSLLLNGGTRGSVVVKALCYKPEGRGFDSR